MATLSINPATTARSEYVIVQQTRTCVVATTNDTPPISGNNSFSNFQASGDFVNVAAMKKTIWLGFNFQRIVIPDVSDMDPAIYFSGAVRFTLVGVETSLISFSSAFGYFDPSNNGDSRFNNVIGINPFPAQLCEIATATGGINSAPLPIVDDCMIVYSANPSFQTILYPLHLPIHADKVEVLINNFSLVGQQAGIGIVLPITFYFIARNLFPY